MPKGHVMSKPFLVKPMKDTMLDYTWRTNGKEVLICPECKKNGTPRRQADDKIIMLHREVVSDFRAAHPVEFCVTSNDEIRAVLVRKEKARLYSLEYMEQRKAEKAERKTARHKKFLLENYGQSMTEIALLLPLFCLLLFGTIDLGRLIQAHTRVSNAAHSAMRYAQNVENGNTTTNVTINAITSTVQANYPGVTIAVQATYPITIYSNESLTVTASTPFSLITPFVRTMIGQHSITQAATGITLP